MSTPILVVAQSARMIVKLIVDGRLSAVAIDCFADEDTEALNLYQVASLRLSDLKPAVDHIIKHFGVTHVVYGSGFETQVDSLAYLQSRFVIMGNAVDLFRRFQDKPDFFQTLHQLSIPYPETVFSSPSSHEDWLIKPMQGEGGLSISYYQPTSHVDSKRFYWQRYLAGEVFSALFVADAEHVKVLGFNQQWIDQNHEHAFAFAGICNQATISDENQRLIIEWLTALIRVYPLHGLGSLDFIFHQGKFYVLEINARIPASAQLYGKNVFDLHLQACNGVRLTVDDKPYPCPIPMGLQIIYAKHSFKIPMGMIWPNWVVDRPAGGVFIGKGQPVCSIIAQGNNTDKVQNRLQRWQKIIENLLQTGLYHHAISD